MKVVQVKKARIVITNRTGVHEYEGCPSGKRLDDPQHLGNFQNRFVYKS